MQVAKWGDSLAVRLPTEVVDRLGLKEGDDIEIVVAGKRTLEVERAPTGAELLARIRRFRGSVPEGFRFSRDEANERR